MTLKELAGKHVLTGIEFGCVRDIQDCNYLKVTLDGRTYQARENWDDEYRSLCKELVVSDGPCKIQIPDTEVVGFMDEDIGNDLLILIATANGKRILRVGTEDYDDYYPICIMEWTPENLPCNEGIA